MAWSVAVVVPCRNEAANIARLLDALATQTRLPNEIVIVDDQSTDGTGARVGEWQRANSVTSVTVVTGPGRGPGPAMNTGIRATTADIIMRFDGHALPAPDYLERCLDALGAEQPGFGPAETDGLKPVGSGDRAGGYKGTGVVGGVWRVEPGAPTGTARAIAAVVSHPLGSGGAAYRHADADGPVRRSVETVPFGTFPRAVWEHVDGFDESLAVNEDFDFNYRARQAGFNIVLDRRIVATYFARPTLRALMQQYHRYGFWKARMLRKDVRAIRARQWPPALLVPWVLGTLVVALLAPSLVTLAMVAAYPFVVFAAGIQLGVSRRVSPLAAAAAVAIVHLAWGAGFWRGVVTRPES